MEQNEMNNFDVVAAITSVGRNPSRVAVGAFLAVGLWIGLLTVLGSSAAQGEGQKVCIITHVDISPPPAGQVGAGVDAAAMKKKFVNATAEAETLLRQFAVESRRDQGCVSFQVLQEPKRRNHFTLVQVWADEAAFQAHEAAAHTRATREKLQPILGAPLDQRLHVLFE
jgi:quinol monooxygenase YgiN